jgi:hypothetical protein
VTHRPPAPVSGLADLLIGVLERGVVVALRLDGEPGNRRLLVGFGSPESAEAVLLAIAATSLFRRPRRDEDWWDE